MYPYDRIINPNCSPEDYAKHLVETCWNIKPSYKRATKNKNYRQAEKHALVIINFLLDYIEYSMYATTRYRIQKEK